MSVAEVVSMAMAKSLIVMFEGDRATWQDVCYPKDDFRRNLYRNGESLCW